MYYTIDGLRGMAALLIVLRHIIPLHANQLNAQSSYLAVELFFLFSGFVIAHAYDRRFAEGLGFWTFVKVRLIRLYPLYLLGFTVAVLTIPLARLLGHRAWPLLPAVVIPNLLILPTPIRFAGGLLYPFNNPSWTLFFELVANFAYALAVRHLNNRRLAVIVAVSALGLALTAATFQSLDVGYNQHHFIGGFGRVFFSFFMGVAVYRLQAYRPSPVRVSPWILMAAAFLLLIAPVPKGVDRALYDSLCALVVFPVFAYLSTSVEPGPRGQRLFVLGGGVSYALYLIHAPLGGMLNQVFGVIGRPKGSAALGIAFVAFAFGVAWLAERFYDRPARRWLTKITTPGPKQAAPTRAPPPAEDVAKETA
jgi:peptidoglycan/LPS O-acetylase OafA/YrhL